MLFKKDFTNIIKTIKREKKKNKHNINKDNNKEWDKIYSSIIKTLKSLRH